MRKVIEKRSIPEVTPETISVFDGKEYSILNQEDILYLKSEGSNTKFILPDREELASKRLGFFEEKLNDKQFVRCHNSYVVNILNIDKLGKQKSPYIIMKNGETLPVSASKRGELENRLGLH